jgi:hypothetical protein
MYYVWQHDTQFASMPLILSEINYTSAPYTSSKYANYQPSLVAYLADLMTWDYNNKPLNTAAASTVPARVLWFQGTDAGLWQLGLYQAAPVGGGTGGQGGDKIYPVSYCPNYSALTLAEGYTDATQVNQTYYTLLNASCF